MIPAAIERTLAKATLGLPFPARQALLGVKPPEKRGDTLDADVATILRMQTLMGRQSLDEIGRRKGVPAARDAMRALLEVSSTVPTARPVVAEDRSVPGAAGALRARLYRASGVAAPYPLLVYFHGGGYVLGDLESHDPFLRQIAADTGVAILAIDYRLAPEHVYPAAAEDAVAALVAVMKAPEAFGADPARIGTGGDSAGGALALIAGHEATRQGLPVRAVWAINPVCDLTKPYPSHTELGAGFFLTRTMMDWFMDAYLPPDKPRDEPFASPILLPELGRLPRTWLCIGQFDPLVDEATAFAEKARAMGADVTFRKEPGLIHNYVSFCALVPRARAATKRATDWLASTM